MSSMELAKILACAPTTNKSGANYQRGSNDQDNMTLLGIAMPLGRGLWRLNHGFGV